MNKPTFGEIKGVSNTTIYTQNKNLFDTRFGERTINGVSVKTYPDGSFELNGTPTNGFSLTNVFGSKSYVPSGSYKIKAEIISGSVQKIEPIQFNQVVQAQTLNILEKRILSLGILKNSPIP